MKEIPNRQKNNKKWFLSYSEKIPIRHVIVVLISSDQLNLENVQKNEYLEIIRSNYPLLWKLFTGLAFLNHSKKTLWKCERTFCWLGAFWEPFQTFRKEVFAPYFFQKKIHLKFLTRLWYDSKRKSFFTTALLKKLTKTTKETFWINPFIVKLQVSANIFCVKKDSISFLSLWLFLYDLLTGWWMVSNLAVFVFHVSHNRLVMQDYLRSRKKLIEKSIEIKRKRKGLKNFDVCFSVLFSCYDQSVISEMTTEHFAVSNRLRYSWYFIVS